MAITTIKTTDQLRYALNSARQAKTWALGEDFEEFVVNVQAYIDHCENCGCRVLETGRPDIFTLQGWFADMTHGALIRRQLRASLATA